MNLKKNSRVHSISKCSLCWTNVRYTQMLPCSLGNEHKIWKKKNNKSWVAKGLHGFVVSHLDFEVETLVSLSK